MKNNWIYSLSICLLYLGLTSCGTETKQNHPISSITKEDSIPTSNQTSFFDPTIPFELQSATRGIIKSANEKDTTICTDWKLEKADVPKILKAGQPISGEEWHHFYYVLPCMISGIIEQGKHTYNFKMNAGAWFTVYNADSSSYFGNFSGEIESYFMMGKDDSID